MNVCYSLDDRRFDTPYTAANKSCELCPTTCNTNGSNALCGNILITLVFHELKFNGEGYYLKSMSYMLFHSYNTMNSFRQSML